MKTHTQQQTNLEIETTAIEPKLSRQERSEYRLRKWRGNTLVPVIIALAISALATIAFLSQGANLAMENKVLVAQNEIAALIYEWNVANEALGGPTNVPATFLANTSNTTYNQAITFSQATAKDGTKAGVAATMSYKTESDEACISLSTKISTQQDGVASIPVPSCDSATLTITLK
jgi:hypothetical protein